jgi:hypothetical protein
MVGVSGFEPPTSWSQTMRASRCATPRSVNNYNAKKTFDAISCWLSTSCALLFGEDTESSKISLDTKVFRQGSHQWKNRRTPQNPFPRESCLWDINQNKPGR